MTNHQGPMNDQMPMTNEPPPLALGIGHSLGIGHWALGISPTCLPDNSSSPAS